MQWMWLEFCRSTYPHDGSATEYVRNIKERVGSWMIWRKSSESCNIPALKPCPLRCSTESLYNFSNLLSLNRGMNRCTSWPLQVYTGCQIFFCFSHILSNSSLREKVTVTKFDEGFLKSYLLIHVLYLIISRASAAHMSLCLSAYSENVKDSGSTRIFFKIVVLLKSFPGSIAKLFNMIFLCFIVSSGIQANKVHLVFLVRSSMWSRWPAHIHGRPVVSICCTFDYTYHPVIQGEHIFLPN